MSLLEGSSCLRGKRKFDRRWLTRASVKPPHHIETSCLCNELEALVGELQRIAGSLSALQDHRLLQQYEKLLNRVVLILLISSDAYRRRLLTSQQPALLLLVQAQRQNLAQLRRRAKRKRFSAFLRFFARHQAGPSCGPLL